MTTPKTGTARQTADKIEKSLEEWQRDLTPEQFRVTRMHGTEKPFSHPLEKEKRTGLYVCVSCGAPLFRSEAKFDSRTGWPSYTEPVSDDAVSEHADNSLFMRRTEVRCARCDGHLGHVFPDGPEPTGLRYCMNGTALGFAPDSSGDEG